MFGIVKDAVKIIVGTGLGYSCKDWKPICFADSWTILACA